MNQPVLWTGDGSPHSSRFNDVYRSRRTDQPNWPVHLHGYDTGDRIEAMIRRCIGRPIRRWQLVRSIYGWHQDTDFVELAPITSSYGCPTTNDISNPSGSANLQAVQLAIAGTKATDVLALDEPMLVPEGQAVAKRV